MASSKAADLCNASGFCDQTCDHSGSSQVGEMGAPGPARYPTTPTVKWVLAIAAAIGVGFPTIVVWLYTLTGVFYTSDLVRGWFVDGLLYGSLPTLVIGIGVVIWTSRWMTKMRCRHPEEALRLDRLTPDQDELWRVCSRCGAVVGRLNTSTGAKQGRIH